MVTSARVAQVRLAETLAEADAIEWVSVTRGAPDRAVTVTFAIVRGGEQVLVTATAGAGGEVASLAIAPAGPVGAELASALADATAVVRLATADRGGVLLSTSDGRRYLLDPADGPHAGNEAVEARWGAAWSGSNGS
ncbi:MAG TPA: hypothetical protein VK932_29190 [Kofleriaceae bacterium]|nr:hypothetical protein [Kofleriaceae bacterium]